MLPLNRAPFLACVLLLLGAVACPGPTNGIGAVKGDRTFTVRTAVGFVVRSPTADGVSQAGVAMGDLYKTCGEIGESGDVEFQVNGLALGMAELGTDVEPGTFPVDAGSTRIGQALLKHVQGGETDDPSDNGSIVLTSITDKLIEGNFELHMLPTDGDPYTIQGTFAAKVCPNFTPQ